MVIVAATLMPTAHKSRVIFPSRRLMSAFIVAIWCLPEKFDQGATGGEQHSARGHAGKGDLPRRKTPLLLLAQGIEARLLGLSVRLGDLCLTLQADLGLRMDVSAPGRW
jgi:hypothetical protein